MEVYCLEVTRGSVAGQQAMCVSHDTRVSTAQRLYSDFVFACSPSVRYTRLKNGPIIP